jgi:hypothetical protein
MEVLCLRNEAEFHVFSSYGKRFRIVAMSRYLAVTCSDHAFSLNLR